MINTVWKFPLEIKDFQNILMPKGAKIIHVDAQNDVPCIWALVDAKEDTESRSFLIHGTGHNIEYPLSRINHIGSFQLDGGSFVGHVFEIIK